MCGEINAVGNSIPPFADISTSEFAQPHAQWSTTGDLGAANRSGWMNAESEVSVSEKESGEEDGELATVTTDSFEQVRDQLDGMSRSA